MRMLADSILAEHEPRARSRSLESALPTEGACPVCSNATTVPVVTIQAVPVLCNILLPTKEAARAVPRGDLHLSFCTSCGHVYNAAFDQTSLTYSEEYENSLHFSPRFQEFVTSLADRLIASYDLHNRSVVEIGCGKGDFLKILCERGPNEGIGFDPSFEPDLLDEGVSSLFTVVRDLYTEKYASHEADLVCCRHVLEHVSDPRMFMKTIRGAVSGRKNTALYFEVPNVMKTLRDLAIWDLIYEHYSYFSPSSLAYLFMSTGFSVERLEEVYDRQFLSIDAFPRERTGWNRLPSGVLHVARHVEEFVERFEQKVSDWRATIDDLRRTGKKAVIWGAGSKGVTILNMLRVQDEIEYVVDINPRKQGKHVAGTGQQIVEPSFLRTYRPDTVIIVNPIYRTEIEETCGGLGLSPSYVEA